MFETYPLIATIVTCVIFASLLGFLANRLHLPTILGYLLAGIMLGPYTPGLIADINIAKQLAEIGIILLMFGVGLHFSVKDLLNVHRIALPGAIVQIAITTLICLVVAMIMRHNFLESFIFGLTLSVASTVVLLRAFEQHKMMDSNVAKIAVGWLIAEDIIMIIILVLLPTFAYMMQEKVTNLQVILETIFLTIIKIIAFVMVMIMVGKKLLPKLLLAIAKTKSRELISLGILAIASGFAFIAYTIFGASFALGAFMAGFILNESDIGKKSAEKSLPLQDLFAVLFFISAGMLFDPSVLFKEPVLIIIALLLVVFGKSIVAYIIMRFFRQNVFNSLILAVSIAQIGEFSFILTALALKLGVLSPILYDMVIASAILSITLNPFLFKLAKKFKVDSNKPITHSK